MKRREAIGMLGLGAGAALLPRAALGAQGDVFVAKFQLAGPRVVIDVTIGGKGPYAFMIDTGAFLSLIDNGLAAELGLKSRARADVRGIGGAVELARFEARDVNLGGLRQSAVTFAGYDGPALGPGIRGTLAAGILTEIDGDLDFERGEWRLYPDGRGERPGFERLPSRITRGKADVGSAYIFADAKIEGESHRFLLDTGSPGEVMLFPQAVRRTTLWEDGRPWSPVRPHGIGGAGPKARLVRADALEMGGITIPRPLLTINDADARRQSLADGIIGIGVLQQLNLSTDTKRDVLWARRNALPPPRRRYALSGIWIEQRDGALVVDQVGKGSPAEAAGVQVGDVVLDETFRPLLAKLAGPPGRQVRLKLRRGGGEQEVALRLDPYL